MKTSKFLSKSINKTQLIQNKNITRSFNYFHSFPSRQSKNSIYSEICTNCRTLKIQYIIVIETVLTVMEQLMNICVMLHTHTLGLDLQVVELETVQNIHLCKNNSTCQTMYQMLSTGGRSYTKIFVFLDELIQINWSQYRSIHESSTNTGN